MFPLTYQADYAREEHERLVRAILLERTACQATASDASAKSAPMRLHFHLVTQLAAKFRQIVATLIRQELLSK